MKPPIPPLTPPGALFEFAKSPFHCKGVLYAGTHNYFDEKLDGGFEAFLDSIDQEPVREFIAQKFLASSWFDALPIPVLIAYEARAMRVSLERYLIDRTQYQARRDMRGVYKYLVRLASPEKVLERLPAVFTQMFDFGDYELKEPGPQERDIRFTGIPHALDEYYTTVLKTYAEYVLNLSGATNPKVIVLRPTMEGRSHGIMLETMHLRIMWM